MLGHYTTGPGEMRKRLAGVPGLEPRLTGPEPVGLPLPHTPRVVVSLEKQPLQHTQPIPSVKRPVRQTDHDVRHICAPGRLRPPKPDLRSRCPVPPP